MKATGDCTHSKTCRPHCVLPGTRQRLGVRQSSAALDLATRRRGGVQRIDLEQNSSRPRAQKGQNRISVEKRPILLLLFSMLVFAGVFLVSLRSSEPPEPSYQAKPELRDGAIVRGPKTEHKIALVFTGHQFAEGGTAILDDLASHKARASFFLTGDFLRKTNFEPIIKRIIEEGHYLGPHSDKHLLYCAWDKSKKTLLTRKEIERDLCKNREVIGDLSQHRIKTYFIPPYENCNPEI